MRPVLAIVGNDLRRLLRSREAVIWMLLMPLPFTFFLGIAFRERPARPPVVVLEAASTSCAGDLFEAALEEEGYEVLRRLPGRADAPKTDLRVRVPEGIEAALLEGRESRISISYPEGSLRGRSLAALAERILWRLRGRLLAQVIRTGEADCAALGASPAAVPVTLSVGEWGERPRLAAGFQQALPGNLVMFVTLAILVTGGIRLIQDREAGLVRRALAYPVLPGQIVLGRFLGIAAAGLLECLYFILLGRLLFGVSLGSSPAGLAAYLVLFTITMAGLGVLMGCLLRSAKQVGALGVAASLLLAALGGCWWPIELVPGWLKAVGLSLPTGQAMHAVQRLIVWNDPLAAVAGSMLYMVCLGTLTTLLAVWALRRNLA